MPAVEQGVEIVSLDTLAGGAAVERFNYELQKALDNIGDINTRADAVRSVSLIVKMKPNEERSGAAVSIEIKSTMASIKPEATYFHITNHGNSTIATEYNPKQERFHFNREEK